MDGAEVHIYWVHDRDEMRGALELREQVFCGEQGVPRSEELDGLDEAALHLLARAPDTEQVIGTLRLLLTGEKAKIGRVAVRGDWRRRGIASRMLTLALLKARERGCRSARLAAQLESTGLYEQAGFNVQSEIFQEAGIEHVWMGMELNH